MPSRRSWQACANTSDPSSSSRCSLNRTPDAARASIRSSVALRTASGSRRTSSPLSSITSNAHMKTSASCRRYRIRSKLAMPSSPHDTASPSIMQDRERSPPSASTMSGKRYVRSLPGRLYSRHPVAVLAGDDAEAVMLDLVQPHLAGGERVSFGREAGGDEAGRKRTQHGSKHRCAAAKCESSGGISGDRRGPLCPLEQEEPQSRELGLPVVAPQSGQ